MIGDTVEQGGTDLMKTDSIVVAGGGQQATTSPTTVSLNRKGEEKASKPVVEFQNVLCDDGEELCRICRTSGEEEHPLYHPCACTGSIKFTHEECLLQWLNYRNTRQLLHTKQCEICKHAFVFQCAYAENTPSRLPLLQLISGIVLKEGLRMTRLLTVLSLCLLVIGLVIPFTIAWLWRLTFVRSFSEAHKLFISRCTPGELLMEWFHGVSLLGGLVFRMDIGFLPALVSTGVLHRLRELWHQRIIARRPLVEDVNGPRPGHVWFWREFWMLKKIIYPIPIRCLLALCVRMPLTFARWMFPSLGYSLTVNTAVDRYAWLGCLGAVVLWYRGKRMKQWLWDLHDSVRDDRYLIGKRLQNRTRKHDNKSDCTGMRST